MAQFIGTSMSRGFAGMLTRGFFDNTTEVKANDTAAPVKAFGAPVKWNSTQTGVTPVTAAADAVIGFAVRAYGQAIPEADGGSYQQQNIVTILKRGYIAVANVAGTVTAGGQVSRPADSVLTLLPTRRLRVPFSRARLTPKASSKSPTTSKEKTQNAFL